MFDTIISVVTKSFYPDVPFSDWYVYSLKRQLSDLYEYHIMEQLPVKTRNECKKELVGEGECECESDECEPECGTTYSIQIQNKDYIVGPDFRDPLMDPKKLWAQFETYEDEFTKFLGMKWLFNDQYCVCQKRFTVSYIITCKTVR